MRAIVLSAGYGTRLGELTEKVPKPMLRLNDRPLLEYVICHLANHSFNEIVVNLHFMPDLIKDYFGDGSRFGVNIVYSYEKELLGTAGGIKKVEDFFREEKAFLVHYGDVLTDQNYTAMLDLHLRNEAFATLLLHKRERSNSVVSLDQDRRITQFLERPSEEERSGSDSPWVNSGVSIVSPKVLDEIPAEENCDLPRDIFSRQVTEKRLFGFPLSGFRIAVDSPQRLAEARSAVEEEQISVSNCTQQ